MAPATAAGGERDARDRQRAVGGGGRALAVIVLGAAPMASAAVNRTADPILALAIAGGSTSLDLPAPGFRLTDQNGRPVTLASLRGKVVLMTFLDPVCTTDCPIIAQEFKQAGVLLGAQDPERRAGRRRGQPDLPVHRVHPGLRPAGRAEHGAELAVPDRLAQPAGRGLAAYGVTVQNLPAGAMSAHNDLAVVIDRSGSHPRGAARRPGPRHQRAPSPRSPCCSASTPGRRWARS